MSFSHLFLQLVLRPAWRDKGRNAIAIVGVALGVAVMLSIRLANISVTESFSAAVDSVNGSASLVIRGVAGRFDELRYPQLERVRELGHLSPIVEGYAMLGSKLPSSGSTQPSSGTQPSDTQVSAARTAVPPSARQSSTRFPRGELLHVLGVDVLLDFPLRDYQLIRTSGASDLDARETLRLLNDPRAIVLTEKFLRRHQLRVGQEIPLTFGSRIGYYTIRGVLLDRGPAQTLDGNFALMDIAAAQLAMDRLGVLDRVDLLLPPGVDPHAMLADVQKRLPPELVVELPDATSGRADLMISAFQFNLSALSAVALIVGLFLIYNNVSMSVAARRAEIGMLQAIGAPRATILGLFLGEALLLAACGTALGIPFGRLLGTSAVRATAQTVETFYIAAIAESSASAVRLSPSDILVVVAIVIPLTLVAAFLPAYEAASLPPVTVVRGNQRRLSTTNLRQLALYALGIAIVSLALTRIPPIAGLPLCGFLAELGFMISGALLVPLLLRALCAIMKWLSQRPRMAARTPLRLASANLEGELPRVSISVAALGVSLSMMVAIAIMVGSFRETVVYWLNSALSAELSVKPVMQTSAVSESRLSRAATDSVTADPDVLETIGFSSRQLPFQGRSIRLAVTELDKTLQHARLIFKSPATTPLTISARRAQQGPARDHALAGNDLPAQATNSLGKTLGKELDREIAPRPRASIVARPATPIPPATEQSNGKPSLVPKVLISESFSLLFGVGHEEQFVLPTPRGEQSFHAAAIYYDYASNQGTVTMDVSTYRHFYGDSDPSLTPQHLAVFLRDDADPDAVRQRIISNLGADEQVYCVTNSEVLTEALKIFESTFAITYALQFIAILVAGLGVTSTLIALIYQRQRDIGLLSLIGATSRQVRQMIVVEAIAIGLVSQVVGIIVGTMLALVLIFVVNVQSFGWTIQIAFPWSFALQSTLLVLAAAALFGIYPAIRAANFNALQTVRDEHT